MRDAICDQNASIFHCIVSVCAPAWIPAPGDASVNVSPTLPVTGRVVDVNTRPHVVSLNVPLEPVPLLAFDVVHDTRDAGMELPDSGVNADASAFTS